MKRKRKRMTDAGLPTATEMGSIEGHICCDRDVVHGSRRDCEASAGSAASRLKTFRADCS